MNTFLLIYISVYFLLMARTMAHIDATYTFMKLKIPAMHAINKNFFIGMLYVANLFYPLLCIRMFISWYLRGDITKELEYSYELHAQKDIKK